MRADRFGLIAWAAGQAQPTRRADTSGRAPARGGGGRGGSRDGRSHPGDAPDRWDYVVFSGVVMGPPSQAALPQPRSMPTGSWPRVSGPPPSPRLDGMGPNVIERARTLPRIARKVNVGCSRGGAGARRASRRLGQQHQLRGDGDGRGEVVGARIVAARAARGAGRASRAECAGRAQACTADSARQPNCSASATRSSTSQSTAAFAISSSVASSATAMLPTPARARVAASAV